MPILIITIIKIQSSLAAADICGSNVQKLVLNTDDTVHNIT